MKKSVLLPYERYEYLLSQQNVDKIPSAALERQQKFCSSSENNVCNQSEGIKRLDKDLIRSCFPVKDHLKVNNLLSLFEQAPRLISFDETGEVCIGGHQVHGCHITEILCRILATGANNACGSFTKENVEKSDRCSPKPGTLNPLFKQTLDDKGYGKSVKNCVRDADGAVAEGQIDTSWIQQWRPLEEH